MAEPLLSRGSVNVPNQISPSVKIACLTRAAHPGLGLIATPGLPPSVVRTVSGIHPEAFSGAGQRPSAGVEMNGLRNVLSPETTLPARNALAPNMASNSCLVDAEQAASSLTVAPADRL